MSFTVEGDYFEACTCQASCPCVYLSPATEDRCDVMIAWHIDKGSMDGVKLDGLNAVLAAHTPKMMTDGNWAVALYLDNRADDAQSHALHEIFSGHAGGHLANFGPLIGKVHGVRPASISYEIDGKTRRLVLDDIADAEVAEMVGLDGVNPTIIENPSIGVIPTPVRQAKAVNVRFEDEVFTLRTSGTQSFIAPFSYSG
jgi:hypothetical protein